MHNLRDYTLDKHKTTDDKPFGGGPGMVMKIEPIYYAIQEITKKQKNLKTKKHKTRVILLSAKGKQFDQKKAKALSKYQQIILICGRYEGVDERVAKYLADEEISIGNYVLTGGELPAMIVVDAVTRLLPKVLGEPESLKEESFFIKTKEGGFTLEYPQYTRPAEFKGWKVPKILLSGDHQKIKEWREKHKKVLQIAKSK